MKDGLIRSKRSSTPLVRTHCAARCVVPLSRRPANPTLYSLGSVTVRWVFAKVEIQDEDTCAWVVYVKVHVASF